MIRIIQLILIIMFLCSTCFSCKTSEKIADKETEEWRYEIEPTGTAKQGSYQFKVWTYSKDYNTALYQSQKNAVHAVLFKGIPAGLRIPSQEPLILNPKVQKEKAEYFESFFEDGGEFQKYVYLVNNGAIASGDRIKINKEYKIGVVCIVNIQGLRKHLEQDNIIKSLNSSF